MAITGGKQKDGTYELSAFYSDFENVDDIRKEMISFAREKHMLPIPESSRILIVDDEGQGRDTLCKEYHQMKNNWFDM